MTSSGTNDFAPSNGEVVLFSYAMCGIRRTEILQEHLTDARLAMNIMLAEWGNDTPNLWKVDLIETPLVQGTATYAVDPSTIMMLDAYIRIDDGNGNPIDRIIWPISRTEYASMPNKDMQAAPTVFWFDRLLSPTVTLWQVPDNNGPYTLRYYRITYIYDANLPNGETPDIPNLWLAAFSYGLAARLAEIYGPDRADRLMTRANQTLAKAQEQNTENVPLMIGVGLDRYYY